VEGDDMMRLRRKREVQQKAHVAHATPTAG
jgi:hypothetical protein